MMTTMVGTVVLLAQSVVGLHGRHVARPGCCAACGVEQGVVATELVQLQACPNWRARDRAARRLRRVDWHCHPEVVEALAFALMHDCADEVREEAAESLAKMAACLPAAHLALSRAAECDPDHSTRKWARKALRGVRRRCTGACPICGPVAGGPIGPLVSEPVLGDPVPVLPPGAAAPPIDSSVGAPADLPAVVPGASPFSVNPGPVGAPAPVPSVRFRPDTAPPLVGPLSAPANP
jgi:hypothetical protein